MQHGEMVIVSETDRVYQNTGDAIELEDPYVVALALRKRIRAQPLCGTHGCRRHRPCQILQMTNGCK
jgi:hypothetical protein